MFRRTIPVAIVVALMTISAPALSYEAEPQPLLLQHADSVMDTFEYDTGWWPEQGAIQTQFVVTMDGSFWVEMEGLSILEWPPVFTVNVDGVDGGGALGIQYGLDIDAKVKIDLLGYQGEFDVPYDPPGQFAFDGVTLFTPFVLPEADERPVEIHVEGDKVSVIESVFTVLAVVDIVFHADLKGAMGCAFEGDRIRVSEDAAIEEEGGTAEVSPADDGQVVVPFSFEGSIDCSLSVVVVPWVEVCVPIGGCTQLASFDIPIEAQTEVQELVFEPVEAKHDFPRADISLDTVQFGDVPVGTVATVNYPVNNNGNLFLDAEFVILPEENPFDLFPPHLWVGPNDTGGLVLYFSPPEEGEFSATMNVVTSDPAFAVADFQLEGNGVIPVVEEPAEDVVSQPDEEGDVLPVEAGGELVTGDFVPVPDEEDQDVIIGHISTSEGCGCRMDACPELPSGVWLLLLVVGLLALAVRRATSRG